MIFYGYTLSKNNTFRDYAHCKEPNCNVRFIFRGMTVNFTKKISISSTSDIPNHTQFLAYALTSSRRQKIKKRLRFANPKTIHNELINKMDEDLARNEKNYKSAHSLAVLQKAQSEVNCANNRHQNDYADILLRLTELNFQHQCIKHYLLNSFSIYLGIDEQIEMLNKSIGLLELMLDSTGSVVRKPHIESMRVNYYAGVININQHIVPVLEMITNDHTANYISSDYLRVTYEAITNNKPLAEHITPVFFCYPHNEDFLKTMTELLEMQSCQRQSYDLNKIRNSDDNEKESSNEDSEEEKEEEEEEDVNDDKSFRLNPFKKVLLVLKEEMGIHAKKCITTHYKNSYKWPEFVRYLIDE
ncbi:hypothetical protein KQX54_014768 [Cotesia glomerata]|uniref:Uncharacterized protein n=1 Tax=Cotesia glomerata TaxID=32391 RepID=A0AAV7HUZ2_COTGL|nr:hypothetical protein KQX54_014768 [Cotesia glomerata]